MPDEPEDDGGGVVAPDTLGRVDALDHGRLANVADVDGGAEAAVDLGRVEQHVDLGLEARKGTQLISARRHT